MKKGWEIKQLGDTCEIVNGGTPKSKVSNYWDGDVQWITPKDLGQLNGRYIDNTPRKISELGLKKSSAKLFPKKSVILSTRAPIGYLAINLVEMATNQGCRGIVPKKNLFTEYLYFYLSNSIDLLNSLGTGATFRELSTNALKSVQIPIPPLPEQKRIVKILDKAFEAIDKAKANAERNLANVKELFESYLNGIFSNPGKDWEEKRLGEVCLIRNGGTPKTGSNEYWDGDIHWITPKDMGKLISRHVYNTSRKISHIGLQKSSAKLLPRNSLILSTRAPIGHLAINKVEMATNQGCRGIIPSKDIVTTYLYYFLSNSIDMLNKLGTGATFKELSTNVLSSIFIPIPPLPEQKRIVSKLDALSAETNRLVKIYQQKIADLEELKKSILQKAFEGEL